MANNTVGTSSKTTIVEINWLKTPLPLHMALTTLKGIYIIEKYGKPIYVGSALEKRGIRKRIVYDYYRFFTQFGIVASPYKAKIGIIKNEQYVKENAEDAEKIITRTLIKPPSEIDLNNSGREKEPLIVAGKFQLTFKGYPPRYLSERIDLLNKNPKYGTLVEKIFDRPLTFNINKTPTEARTKKEARYEAFANSLTLTELQELEWV